MDRLPDLVLLRIFKYLPRRTLEDSVIDVCRRWECRAIEVLSRCVHVNADAEVAPGFIDDIDLSRTRQLTIEPGWSVNWHKLIKYGVKRTYYDDLLKRCNPAMMKSLSAPLLKVHMPILLQMSNLTSITLELKNQSWSDFIPHLVMLPKLQVMHIQARGSLSSDQFRLITDHCPGLTSFSFPGECRWDTDPFLSVLKETAIRKISPWSGLGGSDTQSIQSLITVLTDLPDLIDFELYLKMHPSSELNEEYVNKLHRLPDLLAQHKTLRRMAIFVCSDVTRAEMHNFVNNFDMASHFDFVELLGSVPQLEELMISGLEMSPMACRAVGNLTCLKTIMLSDIEVVDGFGSMFDNNTLESITLARPFRSHFNQHGVAELMFGFAAMSSLKHVTELTLNLPTEELRMELLVINDLIRNAVLEFLNKGASRRLIRLSLTGSWVNNQLIKDMPVMDALERLNLTPYDAFHDEHYSLPNGLLQRETYANEMELSAQAVITFARQKCPFLLQPLFLRHNSLLRHLSNKTNDVDTMKHKLAEFLKKRTQLSSYARRQLLAALKLANDEINFDRGFAEWKNYCENGFFYYSTDN